MKKTPPKKIPKRGCVVHSGRRDLTVYLPKGMSIIVRPAPKDDAVRPELDEASRLVNLND